MRRISREFILSCFLGFVVIWFGVNEILHPNSWAAFAPDFFEQIMSVKYLVMIHGAVLLLSGLALIFNIHRRLAAIVLSLMLAHVVFILISVSGLDEIAVRDIGLLGMSIALAFRS